MVKLPFKAQIIHKLGESRAVALKRLYGIERRFKRDNDFKVQYSRFMKEYLSLNHMKLIDESSTDYLDSCYLPHHAVFKSSGQYSKIRVVFDASSPTSTGFSLNDSLLVGPVVFNYSRI